MTGQGNVYSLLPVLPTQLIGNKLRVFKEKGASCPLHLALCASWLGTASLWVVA